LKNQKAFWEAEIEFKKAIEIKPKETCYLYSMLHLLLIQDRLEEAAAVFKKIGEISE
jgi:Flp pilus assembly protein TadD